MVSLWVSSPYVSLSFVIHLSLISTELGVSTAIMSLMGKPTEPWQQGLKNVEVQSTLRQQLKDSSTHESVWPRYRFDRASIVDKVHDYHKSRLFLEVWYSKPN